METSKLIVQQNQRTKGLILGLIKKLDKKIEGKKKIMKLMFLMDYYNFNSGPELLKSGKVGNKFSIYLYGVFSREVMNCIDVLIDKGYIEDDYPVRLLKKGNELEQEDEQRLDKIIKKFGGESGYVLENETLKMTGVDPLEKRKNFGKIVP